MDTDLQGMILAKLTSIEQTMNSTAVTVARLEERVNGTAEQYNTFSSDHETRLRSLERWKWGLTGVIALMNILIGAYASAKGMK